MAGGWLLANYLLFSSDYINCYQYITIALTQVVGALGDVHHMVKVNPMVRVWLLNITHHDENM